MAKVNYGKLQDRAHLTCIQASEVFNVDPTTVRRWRRNEIPAPTSVILCLQSIVSGNPVNVDEFAYPDKLIAALETLTEAIQHDPSYAYTWHCNVTGAALDSGVSHLEANEAAARFMQLAFQVDTLTGNQPFLGPRGASTP